MWQSQLLGRPEAGESQVSEILFQEQNENKRTGYIAKAIRAVLKKNKSHPKPEVQEVQRTPSRTKLCVGVSFSNSRN
jgi:hypothetical protein